MPWKLVRPLLASLAVAGLLGLAPGAAQADHRHPNAHERLRTAVSNGDLSPRQAYKKHQRIHQAHPKKHRKAHRRHRRHDRRHGR